MSVSAFPWEAFSNLFRCAKARNLLFHGHIPTDIKHFRGEAVHTGAVSGASRYGICRRRNLDKANIGVHGKYIPEYFHVHI